MSTGTSSTGAGTDFAKLYAELGVTPDCGLDAFKQAYRRRVAGLHPDRPSTANRNPDLLIALNLGYAAVLDFHRSQGRIPGAALPAADRPSAGTPPPRITDAPRAEARRSAAQRSGTRKTGRRVPRTGVLLLPVLLLIAAIWRWLPTFDPPAATAGVQASQPGLEVQEQAPVRLGMDRHTVAALIGDPVSRDTDDSQWVYGPSWLRFECGRLVDWYSSPLQPLRVGSRTPTADDFARHAASRTSCTPRASSALTRFPGDS